jgi:serine phosphatase RsbU (regulator of sigma subunit)/anti-sigma regulatory factor (Ser/Thr protein kinase)
VTSTEYHLRLDGGSDTVPGARRLVDRAVLDGLPASIGLDAELVVTELVTNALLHAGPPVDVRLVITPGQLRAEVVDRSHVTPVVARPGADAMTGRGLRLVVAMSQRWGVEPRRDGKMVWAEVTGTAPTTPSPEVDVDALLASWPDDDVAGEPRFAISLGDVPTDLLLAAKGHVDNLVREFALASTGAASGASAAVPPRLSRLIETVATRFAEARQSIKRQALAAASAGERRTSLVLTLPVSAAEAGEEYLAALDEVDAYARAARLLTLESPPQHRAFRRWYVQALVEQLRRVAAGKSLRTPPTLEQHLLDELGVVAMAQQATDRVARLQSVTAALAGAATHEQVAAVVVSVGVQTLAASGGSLVVPADDEHIAVPGSVGYADALIESLRAERLDAELPAATALRTGQPVWLESRHERDRRFPALTGMEPSTASLCAVPLVVGGQTVGALRFSFEVPRLFDEDERRFVLALAAQTAQALDRSDLYHRERAARGVAERLASRLTHLQDVTAALAAARDADRVADLTVHEAADTLGATLAALCVVDGPDTVRVMRMRGASPQSERQWQRFPLSADLPASESIRTGKPVVVGSRDELTRRYPALAGQVPEERALVCVPLSVADEPFGSLSLSFPADHVLDDAEFQLLLTIGRQCALALERARLFATERSARQRTMFLADATQLLTSSLEPTETLEHLTALLVPEFADWAIVHLLAPGSGGVAPTAVAHRDPAVTDQLRELLDQQRLDATASGGVGEVLRTGRSVRYARVPDEIRARAIHGVTDPVLAAQLAPRSGMAVALQARGRIIGVVALARTTEVRYADEDLRLVEDVAARAAVAVLNAQEYDREREAAVTLQRSLLPQQLPSVPGVSFAWRYLPAGAGTHVGGDWYDVIPLEGGRVGLVIGDVMGRGLHAAAVMGQLRATARAYAAMSGKPPDVLRELDIAVGRLEQSQITTAAFGVLDPQSGALTIASAGHLPPLVVTADGTAAYLEVEPGPPLGAGTPDYPELTTTLSPGTMLLLFTDGLVEDRLRPVDEGLELLRKAASSATDPEGLCQRALIALGRDQAHDDDTAMLAVALDPR